MENKNDVAVEISNVPLVTELYVTRYGAETRTDPERVQKIKSEIIRDGSLLLEEKNGAGQIALGEDHAKRNTRVVVFCEECIYCRLCVHDYHRTGEQPHDPYLSCSKLLISECVKGQPCNYHMSVHANDYCSFGKRKD